MKVMRNEDNCLHNNVTFQQEQVYPLILQKGRQRGRGQKKERRRRRGDNREGGDNNEEMEREGTTRGEGETEREGTTRGRKADVIC